MRIPGELLPEKIWWGYAAGFPKPLPYFMTKICDLFYPDQKFDIQFMTIVAATVAVSISLEGLLFRIFSVMMIE